MMRVEVHGLEAFPVRSMDMSATGRLFPLWFMSPDK
jgi:hypothetical protein